MSNLKNINTNDKFLKQVIQLADRSIKLPSVDRTSKSWVNFGNNNLAPQEFIKLAKESNTQSRILSNLFIEAMGAGFEEWTQEIYTPNMKYNWEELTRRCMKDFIHFGAFAVQITLNQAGNKYLYKHTPVSQVRLGNYNNEGEIDTAYLCTNWKSASSQNVVKLPIFDTVPVQQGETYLYYFKDYDVDDINYYYGMPFWYSCANWILSEILLSKYYLNNIANGFTPSTAILYPNEPENDKKEAIYDSLLSNFSGVENAGNIMLLFGDNGVLPDIKPISTSNNADLYKTVIEEVKYQIITGNGLTHPILAAVATSTGFTSQAELLISSQAKYKLSIVNNIRNFVLDKMNWLLELNGYPSVLNIIDFDLRKEIEGKVEENEEKAKDVLDVESGDAEDRAKEEAEEDAVEDLDNKADENKVE